MKRTSIYLFPEEEGRKGAESLFKEVRLEVPKSGKRNRHPDKIRPERPTSRHRIKLSNIKDKDS